MKILLVVVAVAGVAYLLFRLSVYLGRPLYLQNAFREIDEQYSRLLRLVEGDLDGAVEAFNAWKAEGSPSPATEREPSADVDRARRARDREREINDKFLRLRIRYANDLGKQAEAVAAYRAYLRFRLYKEEFASLAGSAGADVSPEERLARHQEQYEEARKITVAVEESERKLDALLA